MFSTEVVTSTIGMKDETRGRLIQKARVSFTKHVKTMMFINDKNKTRVFSDGYLSRLISVELC